jgi:AraC-like DNA-binding protein
VKASVYAERLFGTLSPGIIRLGNIDDYEALFADLLFGDSRGRQISTYCYGLFFQLLSMHQSEQPQEEFVSKSSAMYNEAVAYIDAHVNQQIKVSDLCEHLHIVPNYLYKLFMRHGGISPQVYIITSKMQTAATLLTLHDDSIAAIGYMVGYPDQGQFSKCFRRMYGVSPSEYRRAECERTGRTR